jgi:hypothetical protein
MNRTYDLGWLGQSTMTWKYFLTACVFVGGLLLKIGVPVSAIVGGMFLAAMWTWKQSRATRTGPRERR